MQVHNKKFAGPIDAVPCPWCGIKLDCSSEADFFAGFAQDAAIDYQARKEGYDVGAERPTMVCEQVIIDKRTRQKRNIGCGRSIIIQGVDKRPRIVVRQDHGR